MDKSIFTEVTMHSFKNWLTEEHDSSKPHHIYNTSSGHEIHVHLHKDEHGNHAIFKNHSLGGIPVKHVWWEPGAEQPSKAELEKLSADDEDDETSDSVNEDRVLGFSELLIERGLTPDEKAAREQAKAATKAAKDSARAEKAKASAAAKAEKAKNANVNDDGTLSTNGGGIATEMATHYWLNEHKHKMAGTHGSEEHISSRDEIQGRLNQMMNHPKANDQTREQIQLRIHHGRAAAAAMLRRIRDKHGNGARIKDVGWTSKPGDIPRFTRGQHNDGQENTSDVAVEVENSKNKKTANADGTHFEGFSLKSSLQKQEITAKNPGGSMDGAFDSPTRKMDGERIGREGLEKNVHKPNGTAGMTTAQRKAKLNAERAKHKAAGGKKGESPYELQSNANNTKTIKAMVKHFHDHVNGLATDGDHKTIAEGVISHLYPDTDMSNSKVKVYGDKREKVRSVAEPNSDHPLKKLMRHPDTTFHATTNEGGTATHIHMTNPKINGGKPVHLYTATPKTKSNASKESTMNWNIKAATSK